MSIWTVLSNVWKRTGTVISPARDADTVSPSISMASTRSTALLGTNLVSNGDFATLDLTGWTAAVGWSAATGAAVHSTGDTTALTQSLAGVTSGSTYQITFTIASQTTGSVTAALGAVVLGTYNSNAVQSQTLIAAASSPVNLTITPTTDFNGSIDNVMVQNVTLNSALPAETLYDSNGSAFSKTYGSAALQSIGIGLNALSSLTTGLSNTAQGYYSLYSNTTGSNNTAQGYTAGYLQADGITPLTDPESSIYIGANARGKDNTDDHTIVIGADAIGQGANTATIGHSNLTRLTLANGKVSIALGIGSPEAIVTAPVGSLYLRTDGGANTTLYVKESGTGNTGWIAK